jgi:citrate synthase
VDFYTGHINRTNANPTDFYTVLIAIARTAGWHAHREEMLLDKEQKIARPRQIYTGPDERPYKRSIEHRHNVAQRQKDALRQ